MNDAKFKAAKRLIQEGNYDAARGVLQTINHPTAEKWLKRIDELDPPFPEKSGRGGQSEQQKYYERENRRARWRKVGDGVYIIVTGLVMLGLWAVFSGLLFGGVEGLNPFAGTSLFMLAFGGLLILIGVIRIVK